MAKKSKRFSDVYWQSWDYNESIYMGIKNLIDNIAMARFRWLNLPKSCSGRYLEQQLYRTGIASIAAPSEAHAKNGIFFSTGCTKIGRPNIYGNPVRWQAIGANGSRFKADVRTGYFCYDNLTRRPVTDLINLYARELADIIRTQQIDRMHLKIPYFVTAPKGMEQTVLNVVTYMLGGEPAIVGTESLREIDFSVIQTNTEYHGQELTAAEANVWNKIYTALGIANLTFKAERQIEDEVRAFKAPTDLMSLSPLMCRRECAAYLNERFGLDIYPVWNVDLESNNFNATHDITQTAKLFGDNLGNAREDENADV